MTSPSATSFGHYAEFYAVPSVRSGHLCIRSVQKCGEDGHGTTQAIRAPTMALPDEVDQRATIAFLMCPTSYGMAGAVERIDTHAAIVFLAGDRAYKLKRAVSLPYLDFSTAEKRRQVCDAELALNRRTAPDLYVEVRSVNRGANGSLGFGPGEPVDWLVVMRRFPADDLLESVAQRGELNDSLVRQLADEIVRFHESAEIAICGGSSRVRKVIVGNDDSLVRRSALPLDASRMLTERSLAEWTAISSLLDRRAAEGQVRHCHGDLHLANICLWRGRPTLFDCLEFDRELATIDVLYDLAFLLMDLWERGHHKAASLLFNRYFDMRGEAEGLRALPLFISMRAAIRAHVNATATTQQPTERLRHEKLALARDYLSAAQTFLQHVPPRLIVIGGLSGSGKSTLAALLAPHVGEAPGARWIRTDVLRKRLAGVAPETHLSPASYTPEANAAVYEDLLDGAAQSLAARRSVIVDGVFADPAERARIAAVAAATGVPFSGLWLAADADVLMQRVDAREGDASDADRRVVERQLTYEVGELAGWHILGANQPITTVLDEAQHLLA